MTEPNCPDNEYVRGFLDGQRERQPEVERLTAELDWFRAGAVRIREAKRRFSSRLIASAHLLDAAVDAYTAGQVEVPPTPTTDTEIEKLPRLDLGSARCTCDWPPGVPGVPHRPWCATNGGQVEPEDTGEASQDAAPDAPRGAETVLGEIAQERLRQDAKWGQQNHLDGTGPRVPFGGRLCYMADAARDARLATNAAADKTPGLEHHGPLTWRHILLEEVFEALAEAEPAALRAELVQIGAVSVAWVEAIDRRTAADA